jgi:hypothetical protein
VASETKLAKGRLTDIETEVARETKRERDDMPKHVRTHTHTHADLSGAPSRVHAARRRGSMYYAAIDPRL